MRIYGEPRIYLTVVASIPILFMVLNQMVVASFLQIVKTVSFSIWYALMALYLVIRMSGYISKIRWESAQIAVEVSILAAPLAYPAFIGFTQRNPIEYEGVFMAYLFSGIILMFYLIGRRRDVGIIEKIGYYILAYMFALMVYAGATAGQEIGSSFLQRVALDQLFRPAAFVGYPAYMVSPPTYVSISMALAIPAIIFLALSAELDKTEAECEFRSAGVKLASSLRPAIMLLTFAGASSISLALPLALWLGKLNLRYVTLLPPLGVAVSFTLIILILERYAYADLQ